MWGFILGQLFGELSVSLDSGRSGVLPVCVFLVGSCALFMGPTSMKFSKFFFKTVSHGTIHTFKNYFARVFLVFNFQQ